METAIKDIKFKTGDNVVSLELMYLDNTYHYKKCVWVGKVQIHNERGEWSPYTNRITYAGMDSGITFRNDGRSFDGRNILYHVEKDKKFIYEMIDEAFKKFDRERDEENIKRNAELEQLIKESKNEIAEIKKGNGFYRVGFSRHNIKDFKQKVKDCIYNKLMGLECSK